MTFFESLKFWFARQLVEVAPVIIIAIGLLAFIMWQEHKNKQPPRGP